MEKRRIILASQSKARKEILNSFKIEFESIPADIDEKAIRDQDFKIRALKLAKSKGEKIAKDHKGIIISADGFFVCEGKEFEKPNDYLEATEMLKKLSGNHATHYSGFCYNDNEKEIYFADTFITKVKFRVFDDGEIKELANSKDALKYAAALFLGGTYEKSLLLELEGSLTGLTHSLPMEALLPLLKKSGVEIKVY